MNRSFILLSLSFVLLIGIHSLHASEPVFTPQAAPSTIGIKVIQPNRIRFTVTNGAMEQWYGGFNIHITKLRKPENEQIRFNAFENLKEQIDIANATLPTHALNYMKPRMLVRLENPEFCDDDPGSGRTLMKGYETSSNFKYAFVWYQCFKKYDRQSVGNSHTQSHLMVHELAHVWDYFVFNFASDTISNYYHSISSCLYEDVEDPYWRRNMREFFAQMTVSHFYRSYEPPATAYSLPWDVLALMHAAWSESPISKVGELRRLAIC